MHLMILERKLQHSVFDFYPEHILLTVFQQQMKKVHDSDQDEVLLNSDSYR